jgi:AcrR family transcriptional regulator
MVSMSAITHRTGNMTENSIDDSSAISKKEMILQAATKLFLKKDFKTVSTQEIAQEAGVAKGTVFHHYANKHLLALLVLEEFIKEMNEEFAKMKEGLQADEIIAAMIRYAIDMVESASGLNQLLMQIVADIDYLSKEPQNEVEQQIQDEVKKIEALLGAYIQEFALIFEQMGFENPVAYSRIFIASLDGLGLQVLLNPKPDKELMEQLVTSMIALFTKR